MDKQKLAGQLLIRAVKPDDKAAINGLLRAAFPEQEREDIVCLAEKLNASPAIGETLALVAQAGDDIIAYVAFSILGLSSDERWSGYILSPLAVHPDYQRRGVGALLVEAGREQLKSAGADWILVYGDPAYYGRFGFDTALAERFEAPYELAYPFGWQALRLGEDGPRTTGKLSCVDALADPRLW